MSKEEDNIISENQIEIPIVNILIIITVIFILIIPSMLKLNKALFIFGFIMAVLIMNFLLTFFKVLYYDNSWYTCKYQYNNSYVYKEALNDVVNDTKNGFIIMWMLLIILLVIHFHIIILKIILNMFLALSMNQ